MNTFIHLILLCVGIALGAYLTDAANSDMFQRVFFTMFGGCFVIFHNRGK